MLPYFWATYLQKNISQDILNFFDFEIIGSSGHNKLHILIYLIKHEKTLALD